MNKKIMLAAIAVTLAGSGAGLYAAQAPAQPMSCFVASTVPGTGNLGGLAGADGGGGLRLRVIGFLAARGLLLEERGLTGGLGGRLFRAGGLLRQLGARERVGGGIRRRIDAEEEFARLHLGAFGVIDGLENAGHARPDFHLAHAFHLRRGDGLLGEVGRSDGHDGHGERAGGRRGALLAATD